MSYARSLIDTSFEDAIPDEHGERRYFVISRRFLWNGPAIRPKEQRGRTDSESVIFGMRPGIIPPQPAHIIDHAEWNDGECGKCGSKTPYCKRCGVTWCVGCESQTCKVSASQEI